MDFVGLFPPELVEKIFYFLSIDDLLSASRVNVSWYIASNSSWLWRAAIKKSSSRDRFIELSDLDKFNGISSNYVSDYSFNVERPSTSRLPPINPWKLSLCKHNFVHSNLRGTRSKPRLAKRFMVKLKLAKRPELKLARHTIVFENDVEIIHIDVTFPSKSAQDGVYLPVLLRRQGETDKGFYLMRLDGVPKDNRDVIKELLSTEAEISHACIDRHGVGWVEDKEVFYLPFVENFWLNFNSSQIKHLGSVCLESDDPEIESSYLITMDTNYFAVCYKISHVKIWERDTFKLKAALLPEIAIHSFNFNNGHLYTTLSQFGEFCVQIYDVKQDKLMSDLHVELSTRYTSIVFGVKYYAIVFRVYIEPCSLICVHEIGTNQLMMNITTRDEFFFNNAVWFVDNYFLYTDKLNLKVLNLVDWNISEGLSLKEYSLIDLYKIDLDVIDSCLLVIVEDKVDVWDWKLGRKLQVIAMPQVERIRSKFHVNEIRLVCVGETSIGVVGFL